MGFRLAAIPGALATVLVGCTFTAVPQSATEARDGLASQTRLLGNEVSGQDLLYITGFENSATALFIYSYPQGQHVKTITGYPLARLGGECADATGHVYVVNTSGSSSQVLIYAHGGTSPERILSVAGGGNCSVDRNSGDLALLSSKLLIYPKAKGPAKSYSFPQGIEAIACDYDSKGNVFIEGVSSHVKRIGDPLRVTLSELPKGHSQIVNIAIPRITEEPSKIIGSDRWDGKYLALGNGTGEIYRLAISGGKAKSVGVVSLDGSFDVGSIWIQANTIVGGNANSYSVMIWAYPKGGEPTKVINNVGSGDGVAVSVAPPR